MTNNNRVKTTAIIAYVLMGVGMFTAGGAFFVALVMSWVEGNNYKGKDDLLADHFRYIKRTCLFSILWTVIAIFIVPVFGIGFIIGFISFIWVIYRAIKGYSALTRDELMFGSNKESEA